jgi:hypothetical protein
MAKVKAKPKHKNIKVVIDGIKFDSMKEGKRYYELKLMQERGLIESLAMQQPFVLAQSVVLDGKKKPAFMYFADFCYQLPKSHALVVEDVKSLATRKLPAYRIKKHLMKSVHDIEITEI